MADKQKDEIYEASYSNLSMIESFQLVRDFIVARAHAPEKEFHPHLFRQYKEKMTDPQFITAFTDYFDASQKKNSPAVLIEYMQKFYFINNTSLTNSAEFSAQLLKSKAFQEHIKFESKALLSGDRNYSTLHAANEAKEMREKLIEAKKVEVALRGEVSSLSTKLNTLITNIKTKFGLGQETVDQMMSPPKEEINQRQNPGIKM